MAIIQAALEQVFDNAVLAEDPNLAPALQQGQDLYFKRKAYSQITASATQENIFLENNIFPVSATSTMLYKHASNVGLPVIQGALPSYGNITLVPTTGTTSPVAFTITAGTKIVNSSTGVQYEVTTDTAIANGAVFANVKVPIKSILAGKNTYSLPGSTLTFNAPYVLNSTVTIRTATVNNDFVAGWDTPTDQYVSSLIYSYMQNPRGGGSIGDYYKWALQSDPTITQARIIPAGGIQVNDAFLLIAVMGGSNDPNVNIELSYPISRQVSIPTINTCSQYIEKLRPVNDNPVVITVSTFALAASTPNYVTNIGTLNPVINLTVALVESLTLDTVITGLNGQTKTVREWILYQFRYAILSAPYTGTTYEGGQFLLGEQITTLLSNGLGGTETLNGYLCSILVNAIFIYSDANVTNQLNIPVPNGDQFYQPGTPTTLNIIYDIDTTIINITVV